MEALRSRIRALAVGIGACALVTAGAGTSLAASDHATRLTASATSTIRACVKASGPQKGLMRYITSGKCSRGETAVTWSVTGPPGPTGRGVATHLLSGEVQVYSGPNMTVSLACLVESEHRWTLGWSVVRPPGGPDVVFADAVGTVSNWNLPWVGTMTEGRIESGTTTFGDGTRTGHTWFVDATEDTRGPGEVWLASGDESFHARFMAIEDTGEGPCPFFATY